jgi:PAS domain S-box-containing protein
MKSTIERVDIDELLRTLADEAPAGICIMQDGKFRYFNSNFPIATGYTADELMGKDSLEIVAPEDKQTVRENTVQMLKGELLSPYQFRIVRKDGDTVWIMATVKSVRYQGRPAILGSYMEVTERRKAEERIRESERHYRLLAENIADVVWTVDISCPTRLTYISPSVTRLLGYSVEESMGKEMKEIFTPVSFDNAMKAFAEEMANEQTTPADRDRSRMLELQLRHRNGSLVDIEANFSLLRGADGQNDEILAVARDISGRKQVEETLEKSEERYRKFTENASEAIFVVQDGMIRFMNAKGEQLSGYSLKELASRPFVEFIHPDDVNMVVDRHSSRLKGEPVPQTYEFRIIRKEGGIRWGEINAVPISWEDEPAVLCFMSDVTERKQAEDALRQSEERYRTILDEMGDGYFETDVAGNITFANDALMNLLGYSGDEIIGMNSDALRPEEQRKVVFEAYNRMYKTGQPLRNFSTEIICKDGRHVFAETSAFPIRDDKGEIIGFRGVRHDVTESKQTEKKLRESEERYRLIFETSLDCITQVDGEGRYLAANPATAESLGLPVEELVGKSVFEVMPPEVAQGRFENMKKALNEWQPQIFEDERAERFFHHIIIPIKTSDGNEAVQVITRDITERKQATEALRQSEERYRTILEEMEDAYFETDLGGGLTYVNNATCRSLGYSEEELIGMSYKGFTAEEDIEPVFRVFNEVYRTGVPNKGFCWKIISKDGTRRFVEHSAFPLRNDKREIIGFRGVGHDVTEQRQAEEKLRQSREHYRALFDSSVIGALVVDAETMHVVMANEATRKMFGFSSAEAGINPLDFVPREDRQKNLEFIVKEVLEKDSRKSVDLPAMTKDGRKIWVNVTGARITHKDKLAGLFCFVDITERKQAEEKLRQSEENYKTLFNSSGVGMYVLDVDTFKIVKGNRSAAEMAGFNSVGDGVGTNPLDLVVPEDREQLLEIATKEYEQDLRRTHEVRVRGKDGKTGWITISSARITHEGRPASLVSITDITERKRMEEALRQSEENYRALFDSSVIGTIVLDAETMRVLIANQAAAEIFGFGSAEEGIGLNPLDFVPPEDVEQVVDLVMKEMFEQDLRQPREIRALTKDGRQIWISATGARIMHEGRLAGLISFADVTEQKRQRERLMMTDRLASLGELAAGTAHELNNPLTSILGFSQLLMEKEVPGDIREDVKLINTEAQRAANVTKNLLTFARKHAPVKEPNRINSIIEDVLELRAHAQKMNDIEVEKHLARYLPEVMVDYFQMQQVFLNIIINAEFFMTETHSGGTLTVSTKKQNSTVVISIADDGPGIPPENLARIFDPFFTTKEPGKGTGLGLSICHGIVTEHGGQIYVRSQLGRGTTVFIELPLSRR